MLVALTYLDTMEITAFFKMRLFPTTSGFDAKKTINGICLFEV